MYYAAQSRKAVTAGQQASTSSLVLLYLSAWRSESSAREFAKLYARELNKKYSGIRRDRAEEAGLGEQVYQSNEGPIVIVQQGSQVLVSESLELDLARKLQLVFFGAQQGGDTQQAAHATAPDEELSARLAKMMASCGLMKASLLH